MEYPWSIIFVQNLGAALLAYAWPLFQRCFALFYDADPQLEPQSAVVGVALAAGAESRSQSQSDGR